MWPGPCFKVIFLINVVEISFIIDGVVVVIDSGLVCVVWYLLWMGM